LSDEEAKLAHRPFGNANQAQHSFTLLADIIAEEEPQVLD
jgi:hypothetical protein